MQWAGSIVAGCKGQVPGFSIPRSEVQVFSVVWTYEPLNTEPSDLMKKGEKNGNL
jgi:hypothetical protein